MTAIELKLGAKDLAEYGGPEWLRFDPDSLADLSYDELDELEAPIRNESGMSLAFMLQVDWRAQTLRGIRAMHWVARQRNGLTKPDFADFKPNPLATDYRVVVASDDPPAGGSSEPPSETAASKKN